MTTRTFMTGSTRNSAEGKLEYLGFNHPKLEQMFAEYMHKHRKLEDGTLRASNNWWKGWDKEVSIQSLNRHVQDLNAIHAGYTVVKFKSDGVETTKYLKEEELVLTGGDVVTEEECCNAIRFNAMAYMLQTI